jgi:hypothetical protein
MCPFLHWDVDYLGVEFFEFPIDSGYFSPSSMCLRSQNKRVIGRDAITEGLSDVRCLFIFLAGCMEG